MSPHLMCSGGTYTFSGRINGVWFCMRCLWSDQFEFVALFMVLVIRGVFQMLFFESCGCF